MNNIVEKYLVEEKDMSELLVSKTLAKLSEHAEILEEFEEWIVTRKYKEHGGIVFEGYSAKDIFNMAPFLDGLGVYNFLVTLKLRPERGKEIIQAGFPRK